MTTHTIRVWDINERLDQTVFNGTEQQCVDEVGNVLNALGEKFLASEIMPNRWESDTHQVYIVEASQPRWDAKYG